MSAAESPRGWAVGVRGPEAITEGDPRRGPQSRPLPTLPLSLPGIVAGSMLVFIPAIGEFVIPELLGGPNTLMIGKVLWNEFFSNRDWPVAAAVAIALLALLVVPVMLFERFRERGHGV